MDDLLSYLQRYTERHHHKRVESLLFTLIFTQLLLSIVLAHADPCERLLKLARTVVSAVQGEGKQGQADVDAAQDEVHVDVFLDIEKETVPKVSVGTLAREMEIRDSYSCSTYRILLLNPIQSKD